MPMANITTEMGSPLSLMPCRILCADHDGTGTKPLGFRTSWASPLTTPRCALHVVQRVAVAAAGSGVSGLPRHLNIVRESSGF
jgi:hypothetical protein